ncbi:MAG: hypothetical protein ACI8P0_001767 [Planctomycetaceae bacterium]|jgi:uncharacterized protein (DUF1499 family)
MMSDMSNPDDAGLTNGKLRPCPDSPNCVCSEYPGNAHSIEPLIFSDDADAAWARLIGILLDQPRTTIVSQTDDYIEARIRTRILRFVDVLEFRLDRATKRINIRSASKVGYSDLGTNRRRVESLRTLFCDK